MAQMYYKGDKVKIKKDKTIHSIAFVYGGGKVFGVKNENGLIENFNYKQIEKVQ